MIIQLAEHRGFCYGVKRAIELAQTSQPEKGEVHSLGPLIHNPQMVEKLAAQGIKVADSLENVKSGTIIIRSHGVGPKIHDQARHQQLNIVDATCPHVRKAQQAAAALAAAGFTVVVIGEKNHPEVKSIVEWAGEKVYFVETSAEAQALPAVHQLGVVVQTTFAAGLFAEIVDILQTKSDQIKIERTICTATQQRQQAAVDLAKTVEVMIVIGGKNSANTRHLAELCRETGCRVYHVETAHELTAAWFAGVQTAGITAGASTPDWLIEEVYNKVEEIGDLEISNQDLKLEIGSLEQGSIIKGKVVSVQSDEVFVDIGYKAEGVIPKSELAYPIPETTAAVVQVDDIIDVYIESIENADGNVVLSKVKADEVVAWDKLEQAAAQQTPVEGQVIEMVKGGVVAALYGIRAFVPASQLDTHYVADLTQYIGQTLTFMPIEIDKTKQRAVLSRRVILQAQREQQEQALLAKLEPNQVVKGTVRRLTDFGAFVDLGGMDGLIHISDLAWERVKHPSEVVSSGQEVEVVVLKVDPVAKRIALSLKQAQRDPWFDAISDLHKDMIVPATITRLAKFGAFAQLNKGVEGLIHISELAERRIIHAEEVVVVGQQVKVKILDIDPEHKRIALSLYQAQQDAERQEYSNFLTTQRSTGVTIGDKLGYLFKHED